jgi:uncharacterized RDD family membrane protein YckC
MSALLRKRMHHPKSIKFPGLRRRFACWLYEGVLIFGVLAMAAYLFGTLTQTRHALHHRHGLQLFLFCVLGLYFTWFWRQGQTLAMKTWRIQVVNAAHQKISTKQALLRYIFAWLWFMPPLVMASILSLSSAASIGFLVIWPLIYLSISMALPYRS